MRSIPPTFAGAAAAAILMGIRVSVLGTGQTGILASRSAFVVASAVAGAVAGAVYARTATWRTSGRIPAVLAYWATGIAFMLVVYLILFSGLSPAAWQQVGISEIAIAVSALLVTGAAAGFSVFVVTKALAD